MDEYLSIIKLPNQILSLSFIFSLHSLFCSRYMLQCYSYLVDIFTFNYNIHNELLKYVDDDIKPRIFFSSFHIAY